MGRTGTGRSYVLAEPERAGVGHPEGRRAAGVDQVGEVAAEAVELPDDEHVARPERAHAAVESRAVVADAGREVVVDVDGGDSTSVIG